MLKVTDRWQLLLEAAGETSRDLELDDRNCESELLLVPGLRYGIEIPKAGEWEIGVGLPVGLTHDSPEWGVIVKVQWEIGG